MYAPGEKLWHFHGGIRLDGQRELSTGRPLGAVPLSAEFVVPVQQHIGQAGDVLVREGQHVHRGQQLTQVREYIGAPVHAPTSGKVIAIENRPVPHPSGLEGLCVVIEADGRDDWGDSRLEPLEDYRALSPGRIRRRVRKCGIVGLGGAAFPTAAKINPLHEQRIHTLVLNGAECEPYITCDDTLLRHHAAEVVEGARILMHTLGGPERCLIAVEEDMPEAYEALREVLGGTSSGSFRLVRIPSIYPTGSEKQLIQVLTGREVPADGLPADIGVVCQNVATARAVYRAVVHGEPLIERIVTVTGRGVSEPGNHLVRIGTPVHEVIAHAGGYVEPVQWLLMGGPMMGVALHDDAVPVVKATNCLLAARRGELRAAGPVLPCIRCGECVRVCPARLLPHELYRLARAAEFDRAQEYDLFDCIECGCCAYVCPSHLPLVHYYRYAKSEIRDLERERQAADRARRRHEFRLERLEREKRERAERLAKKKAAVSHKADPERKKAAVQAAVQRAQARKAARGDTAPTEN